MASNFHKKWNALFHPAVLYIYIYDILNESHGTNAAEENVTSGSRVRDEIPFLNPSAFRLNSRDREIAVAIFREGEVYDR